MSKTTSRDKNGLHAQSRHATRAAAQAPSPRALALAPPAERDLPPHRILIADDDPDATDALRLLLETLGQEAQVAHGGEEAIAAALAEHPDLILLDLSMPGTGGLEVARRLRATLGGDDIRIAAHPVITTPGSLARQVSENYSKMCTVSKVINE